MGASNTSVSPSGARLSDPTQKTQIMIQGLVRIYQIHVDQCKQLVSILILSPRVN